MPNKKVIKYTRYGVEQHNSNDGAKTLLTSSALNQQIRYNGKKLSVYSQAPDKEKYNRQSPEAGNAKDLSKSLYNKDSGIEIVKTSGKTLRFEAHVISNSIKLGKTIDAFRALSPDSKLQYAKTSAKKLGVSAAKSGAEKAISAGGKSEETGIQAAATAVNSIIKTKRGVQHGIKAFQKAKIAVSHIPTAISAAKSIVTKLLLGGGGAAPVLIMAIFVVTLISVLVGSTSADTAPKETVEYINRLDADFITQVGYESEAQGNIEIIGLERVNTSVDDMLALLASVNDGDTELSPVSKELLSLYHSYLNTYSFDTVETTTETQDGEIETYYKNVIVVESYTVGQKVLSFDLSDDQLELLNAIFEMKSETGMSGALAWPLKGYYYVTSEYGQRVDPISHEITEFHTGIDISAPTGTPIYPAKSGTVIWSGIRGTYGNLIIVRHDDGSETYYAHCDTLIAEVGQKVSASTQIAAVGATGRVTGPHLHFEVRINDRHEDPNLYLKR